jgi:hypothetical protein
MKNETIQIMVTVGRQQTDADVATDFFSATAAAGEEEVRREVRGGIKK